MSLISVASSVKTVGLETNVPVPSATRKRMLSKRNVKVFCAATTI